MSMRDLISGEAQVDDDENDDSFDSDTGEVRARPANGNIDDSSEEEEDDDDEEAARQVSESHGNTLHLPPTDWCLGTGWLHHR